MRALARRLVRILKLGALFGILAGLIRTIRRRLRGQRGPDVVGEASWPPLAEESPPAARSGPVTFAPTSPAGTGGSPWVEPIDGACPASHPIKGNAQSGIFHVPGGLSYDRTIPERCYATEDAAEADGFRRAKR